MLISDEIVREHERNKAENEDDLFRGSVINLSLGVDERIIALVDAVANAHRAGIPVVAAAGNNEAEAGSNILCTLREVICVGSVNRRYFKSDFSNFGPGVDIQAPAEFIESLGHQSDDQMVKRSGTSMAAPHVAGVLAIFIGWEAIRDDASLPELRMLDNMLETCSKTSASVLLATHRTSSLTLAYRTEKKSATGPTLGPHPFRWAHLIASLLGWALVPFCPPEIWRGDNLWGQTTALTFPSMISVSLSAYPYPSLHCQEL